MIIEHVWNLSFDTCTNVVDVYVFGRWQQVDSVRGAVVALGMQRMRDIALSCSVLSLLPRDTVSFDPVVFWEHSLGCALVCRQFARKIGFADPGKAYLAGLLHDIGIIAHVCVAPKEFSGAMEMARKQRIPLHEAEEAMLGITHGETGRMVAQRWHFPQDLTEVVASHHDPLSAGQNRDLVAVTGLSDLLCRMSGMGYGYSENRLINFLEQPGFALLVEECPQLRDFDWARFTFELEAYMDEVHGLVSLLYRASA